MGRRLPSMLQALLQAELQALLEALPRAQPQVEPRAKLGAQLPALLQAEFHPPWRRGDGGGSIDLDKTQRNLEEKNVSRPRGSGSGREGSGERPRGRRGRQQASPRHRVEYWHELLAYIGAGYMKRFGRHYPWSSLARKNVWNLARVHSPWRVMALWDLYLESESWWARRTDWSVYGMIRDNGRLMEDQGFREYAEDHEKRLAGQPDSIRLSMTGDRTGIPYFLHRHPISARAQMRLQQFSSATR
jgi:hypothetical protein